MKKRTPRKRKITWSYYYAVARPVIAGMLLLCLSCFAGTVAEKLDDGIPASSSAITPTAGKLWYANGTSFTALPIGSTGDVLKVSGGLPSWGTVAGSGTVTSVAQSFTGGLISVGGSPITGSGTLALTVAGTSGGIPYFSSSSTWASSAALAANQIVLGGGAGTTPATLGNLGTTTTLLHGNAAGAPTWSQIVNADVSSTAAIAGTKLNPNFGAQIIVNKTDVSGTAMQLQDIFGGTILQVTTGVDGTAIFSIPGAVTMTGSTGNITATSFTGLASTATLATNATNTAITNDTTTNATMYPTWVTANTGNLPQKVSSTKMSFNPSTGTLTSTAFSGSGAAVTGILGTNVSPDFGAQSITTSGSITTTASTLNTLNTLNSTENNPFTIKNTGVADGAGAVAFIINTTNAMADSTSKLLQFKNANTEKSYIDKNGSLALNGSTSGTSILTAPAIAGTGTVIIMPNANSTLPIFGQQITFAGPTAARTITVPDASFTAARTDAANTFTGASTASAWVLTSPTITTGIVPTSNDGAALGSTSKQFSDLFLAEGGVINWDNGDATMTQTGDDITVAGITTFGVGTSTALTLGTIETGHASDTTIARVSAGVISVEGVTVPTISSTNTITNKWIQPRITTITSSATPTINTDNCDRVTITALAANITSFTSNLSGTPVNFQQLIIRILDDGTGRTLSFGTSFVGTTTVALPTTTVASKALTLGFIQDTVKGKWVLHASTQD